MPEIGKVYHTGGITLFVVDIRGDTVSCLANKSGKPVRQVYTTILLFERMEFSD